MVRAVVVGSMVADLAFHVPKRPGPGEVIIAAEFGSFRGGKGYNQAVALARLGAEVTMVGAVGHDAYGDGFLKALEHEGIDAGRVVQLRGVGTAVAVPLITPDGEVGFVQYPGANHRLSPAHCAELPDCDVLLLQGEVTPAASERAGKVIRGRGGIVVLSPAPVHDVSPEMLAVATVVCPNEVEARALLADVPGGPGEPDVSDGQAMARALCTESRSSVVTLGAAGATWCDGTGSGAASSPQVQAVDTTGAGDSFCAALAVALAGGSGYAEAVGFACGAGAHAATIRGAEPGLPTRAQIQALLG